MITTNQIDLGAILAKLVDSRAPMANRMANDTWRDYQQPFAAELRTSSKGKLSEIKCKIMGRGSMNLIIMVLQEGRNIMPKPCMQREASIRMKRITKVTRQDLDRQRTLQTTAQVRLAKWIMAIRTGSKSEPINSLGITWA